MNAPRFDKIAAAIALALTLVLAPSIPVGAQAQVSRAVSASEQSVTGNTDAQFVQAINELRRQHGLNPLQVDFGMRNAASQWTNTMVSRNMLRHASNIGAGAPAGWIRAGENVGRGQTVRTLMRAFMASPSHRANVLRPEWTHVAVASKVGSDGRLYTTHRFAFAPATSKTSR